MKLAERDQARCVPSWTATFLRDRCDTLQHVLGHPGASILSVSAEEDSIHCWNLLLLAADGLPEADRALLESLHLLHARIDERLTRGGVGDISPEIEHLIRAILMNRLQRMTDDVIGQLA